MSGVGPQGSAAEGQAAPRGELATLVTLAGPLMLAQGGMMLMGAVDTMVVGRATPLDMAATALGNGVVSTVAVFGLGVGMGIEPLVAQAHGAGERAAARTWLWQGGALGLVLGLPLVLVCVLVPLAFELTGIAADLAGVSSVYIYGRLPGVLVMGVLAAQRAFLSSTGRQWAVLLAVAVANVVNLVLDVGLVLGRWGLPKMGALGTALATSASMILMVVLMAAAIGRRPLPVAEDTRVRREADPAELRRVFGLGWPIGGQAVVEVGVFLAVAWAIGTMSAAALAAHSVALTLASLTFMMAFGIANAATARVGLHVGRGDTPAARRAGFLAIMLGAGFMGLWGLVFQATPELLASLFSPEPAVIAAAAPLVVIAGVFALSDGIQGVSAGALRGAGDTAWPFWTNLGAHWLVGFPLGWYLGVKLGLGPAGYWWGLTAGLTGVGATLLVRFVVLSRRPIRRLDGVARSDGA